MNALKKSQVLSSFIGQLNLRWKGTKLSAVKLPPAPPLFIKLRALRNREANWKKLLSLEKVRLDFSSYSAFYCAVWRQTRKIPFGQVRSYRWLARSIGKPKAVRAVGQALKANPWPLLIPCHRVVRADGSLGGFSSGPAWKKFLINFEKRLKERSVW